MEIKFTLDETDYLAYQLFTVSKSPRIKSKRTKEWLLTTLSFLSLAVILHFNDNSFLGNYFLTATVLSAILFPLYTKWRYKNHYLRHIRDVYKNNFNQMTIIKFTDENIETADNNSEGKIKLTQIQEINETSEHYFIQLLSGQALIIPKKKVNNSTIITEEISSLISRQKIRHNIELNWAWK